MSRKRQTSDERHKQDDRKRKSDDLYTIRHHLQHYLEQTFNIRKTDDFWKFYQKLEAIKNRRGSSTPQHDVQKQFNIKFAVSDNVLHEKLPMYSRHGERLNVSKEDFGFLLRCVKTYQDFQNKNKFGQLKALRNAQKNLPIAAYREEIVRMVKENKVVLIAGDTGCGKSTQVPQYIMQSGFNRIACTQPRRIACITLAKRVAHETLSTYKHTVGHQIRFERNKNKSTNLIFLTEGILLRQASDVDVLSSYDVVILDEVHERHLNMDFLVGLMKCFIRRNDVRLVLMSATINIGLFEGYFSAEGVKVVRVPGRLFPIEIVYKEVFKDVGLKKSARIDCQPYLNILNLIEQKYKDSKGDVLIFLNGASEITTLADAVTQYNEISKRWAVLPLHSALSIEEQDKVFHVPEDGVRKCIIATNIAETSVTIDGVRFVIDSGKVNRMVYDCGVNRLFETDISQDSAKQRSGRAGRTGPGITYRLYSEAQFEKFEPFTPAEIHFVPLENLLLNMVTLGLSDIEKFPFIEKPSAENIKNSLERLIFLEALRVNDGLTLTTLGMSMSKLPVELTIAKMLIVSTVFSSVNTALVLASLLSVQNPIIENRYYETMEHRKPYESSHGEPITLLNLYKGWLENKNDAYVNRKTENSRSWARRLAIEEQRFYEATKLVEQFRDILIDAKFIPKIDDANLNSAERSARHGELKQLKSKRYHLKNQSKHQTKKRLKASDGADTNDDINDIEFRITNDYAKLQKMLQQSNSDLYKDLMLLKLLLTYALYPQVAIEDEFNSSKTVNEKLYHTKNKNYVFLRPTSYFNANPDVLKLTDDEIDVPPNGYFSKHPLSKKHQILVYQKLLETKKTFIVNTFRMPALQTLLLFGNKIATNRTLTKFIFDDFLCVQCPFLWEGKVLLTRALNIRKKLNVNLERKLSSDSYTIDTSLLPELLDYLQTSPSYNIKRLLPADIKIMYTCETPHLPKINPFDPNYPVKHNALGGFNISDNIIYDCIVPESYDIETEAVILSEAFTCPKCNAEYLGYGFLEMFQHENECQRLCVSDDVARTSAEEVKPNARKYMCDRCRKELLLTPVDYLKHKKKCLMEIKEEFE